MYYEYVSPVCYKKQGNKMDSNKKKKDDTIHVVHSFDPVFDEDSKVLVLGTFPSVKSREQHFYYGHPQNRFWKLIAAIFEEKIPDTIDEKKNLLLKHHIAVWDVVKECDIKGSSDSSIKNVIPTDIRSVTQNSRIEYILGNGNMACLLYEKYCKEDVGMDIIKLPSTSPANAAFSLERLIEKWEQYIKG